MRFVCFDWHYFVVIARLAQSVERQPFKLVVVGSSPTVGNILKIGTGVLNFFTGNVPRCRAEAAWPSGLRRQLQALVRKGASSNLAAVSFSVSMSIHLFPGVFAKDVNVAKK